MKRRYLTLVAVAAFLVTSALPVGAITNPTPDGDDHPQVGELLFYVPDAIDPRFDDAGSWFTCSGTLIGDGIVLTAGHCTFAVGLDGASTNPGGDPRADTNDDGVADNGDLGNDVWVNFSEEPDFSALPNPSSFYAPGNNAQRYTDWSKGLNDHPDWHRGTSHPHPDYNDIAFVLADAGVVVLDAEDRPDVDESDYGVLPEEGHLDQYKNQRRNTQRFTPVGYGLNTGFPTFSGGDVRERANVMLVSLQGTYGIPKGTSVVFSGNPGKPHRGGTCFGDSGGPVFEGESGDSNLIVAVTSFGVTFNCVEPGGYYRIDQADDLEFIGDFLD